MDLYLDIQTLRLCLLRYLRTQGEVIGCPKLPEQHHEITVDKLSCRSWVSLMETKQITREQLIQTGFPGSTSQGHFAVMLPPHVFSPWSPLCRWDSEDTKRHISFCDFPQLQLWAHVICGACSMASWYQGLDICWTWIQDTIRVCEKHCGHHFGRH